MSTPKVYQAINAIGGELAKAPLPKLHRNERDNYLYRSIDDVLNRLSPLLVKHKLCILPRVLKRTSVDRRGDADQLLVSVTLKVAFDLVCAVDGSCHTVEAYGEALDPGDKATAKAMSSSYKAAMLQAFCIPLSLVEDTDRTSHPLKHTHEAEPIESWEQWAAGIVDVVASSMSTDALERIEQRQRALLNAISRERPKLYANIGAAFALRTAELAATAPSLPDTTNGDGPARRGPTAARDAPKPRRRHAVPAPAEMAKNAAKSPDKDGAARTHVAKSSSREGKRPPADTGNNNPPPKDRDRGR